MRRVASSLPCGVPAILARNWSTDSEPSLLTLMVAIGAEVYLDSRRIISVGPASTCQATPLVDGFTSERTVEKKSTRRIEWLATKIRHNAGLLLLREGDLYGSLLWSGWSGNSPIGVPVRSTIVKLLSWLLDRALAMECLTRLKAALLDD